MRLTMSFLGEDRHIRIKRRKRQKRVYVRALADGSLTVSAPRHTPLSAIRKILQEQATRVEKLPVYLDPGLRLEHAQKIPFFGQETSIVRTLPAEGFVRHDEDQCRLLVPRGPFHGRRALEDFFREHFLSAATLALKDLAARFPEVANVPFRVTCRYMKQTLGSYRKNPSRISLNLCLVHYPAEFTRLIVSHEVAHHFHPDHSQAFHATLERYFPDHRKKHTELKRIHEAFLYRKHDKPLPL